MITVRPRYFIKLLQDHCVTIGLPEVLMSDGARQYMAIETKEFLKTWGN